jgi:hypothetical protein
MSTISRPDFQAEEEIFMSSAPSTTPQPPGGSPPAPPAKTGGGAKVLLWVLGIFAGVVVLFIIAFGIIGFYVAHKINQAAKNPVMAAAKIMVAANPDLETVSSDDSTIVVHDRKTGKNSTMKIDPDKKVMIITDGDGKSVTMKLDTASNRLIVTDEKGKTATITANQQTGSMEIKGTEGSLKFGGAADKAPDWVPSYPGSNPQGTVSIDNAAEQGGTFTFVTSDPPDKVMSFYGDALKSAGFKVSNMTSNSDGKVGGFVTGQNDADKRSVTITVGTDNDGTHVAATYAQKKQS